MKEENTTQASAPEEDGEEAAVVQDETVLEFLDSLDSYLMLFDSLSSTLRQGWLELASARHSMGLSRISSALFDLKSHPAATTLQVNGLIGESFSGEISVAQTHYTLSKWGSQEDGKCSSVEAETNGGLQKQSNFSQLRHRGFSEIEETSSAVNDSLHTVDDQVQNERSKSIAVFGTLVSPKLRAAQISFETALDAIVKIANVRSSLLSTFAQLQQERQDPN